MPTRSSSPLQDGRVFEALLAGSDSLTDTAVLKINATGGLPDNPD